MYKRNFGSFMYSDWYFCGQHVYQIKLYRKHEASENTSVYETSNGLSIIKTGLITNRHLGYLQSKLNLIEKFLGFMTIGRPTIKYWYNVNSCSIGTIDMMLIRNHYIYCLCSYINDWNINSHWVSHSNYMRMISTNLYEFWDAVGVDLVSQTASYRSYIYKDMSCGKHGSSHGLDLDVL